MHTSTVEEFCPLCGEWVKELVDGYGWCPECVFGHQPEYRTYSGWETFLATHADRLEELMYGGLFLTEAIQAIRDEIRPKCVVCDKALKYAKSGALFCGEHRAYHSRYRRQRNKGLEHRQALEIVLNGNGNSETSST